MNKVKDKLPALVEEELAAAMEIHGDFASMHEGYAVLLEEVEEAEVELKDVQGYTARLWDNIKTPHGAAMIIAALNIKEKAINLAAEAIQVAAMARKILISLDAEKVTP